MQRVIPLCAGNKEARELKVTSSVVLIIICKSNANKYFTYFQKLQEKTAKMEGKVRL